MGWTVATAVVVIVGIVGIVLARGSSDSGAKPAIGDHWHAYLGVNVCGSWIANAPEFESQLGIHSHGDGLMHIHPFSSAAVGKNATVGRFIEDNEGAGWKLDSTSMTLWDGAEHQDGTKCATGEFAGKKANIVWATGHYGEQWTGKLRTGDPADYRPQDGDIVAIGFLPKGAPLEEPPGASSALAEVSDPGATPPSTAAGATTTTTTTLPATPAASTP